MNCEWCCDGRNVSIYILGQFADLPPFELGDYHDRAERLLFSNVHVVLYISEHSGFKKET